MQSLSYMRVLWCERVLKKLFNERQDCRGEFMYDAREVVF